MSRQEIDVVHGPARVGRRTKDLTKRLRPGDIAIIDHLDLDRVAAEALTRHSDISIKQAREFIALLED